MKLRFTIARTAMILSMTMIAAFSVARAQTVVLSEGFEDGDLGDFTSSGSPGWSASTAIAYSGSYSAHGPDEGYTTDLRLTTADGIAIPSTATSATLSFYHWFEFDEYPYSYNPYDGGVLEISDDDGATWVDGSSVMTAGGYNGQLNGAEGNPLGNRYAWVATSNGWQNVVVDLSSYAGEMILVRLRVGTGNYWGGAGWYVDDVEISYTAPVPPSINVSVSPTTLWSPNHTMADIEATVTTSEGSAEIASVQLMSVTSNEADNGEDDGNTVNDIQGVSAGSEDYEFQVRKERSGSGTGRIYTVTYRVTDVDGYWSEASATITVPLSSGKLVMDGSAEHTRLLQQNVPNPFNGLTKINYQVSVAGPVQLRVFDAIGRTVATLVDGAQNDGEYSVDFNSSSLPSGTYYYVLETNEVRIFRSMIISK